jgi:DNA-directed RNA polymerase III subunit RPC11
MLIITTLPSHHVSPSEASTHGGKNRFECRTCPYQMVLDRRYFERKNMKLKEVEDILGGADSWANVDRTDGGFPLPFCFCFSRFFFFSPRMPSFSEWISSLRVSRFPCCFPTNVVPAHIHTYALCEGTRPFRMGSADATMWVPID